MTYKDLATTLIKIGGMGLIVYGVLTAVSHIPYFLTEDYSGVQRVVILSYASKVVLPVLIGLYFVKYGVAHFKNKFPDTMIKTENNINLEIAAMTVLGMYLLYNSLSDLVYHISNIYQVNQLIKIGIPISMDGQTDAETNSLIIATIVEVIFSLWLILGSKGLSNLFNQLRYR